LSGLPQLSVFGSPSPRPPVVIVVGGLPEDSQIIGPFATPALATRFARRQCHGDYTIAPLHRLGVEVSRTCASLRGRF
jgi:hypothetical protein